MTNTQATNHKPPALLFTLSAAIVLILSLALPCAAQLNCGKDVGTCGSSNPCCSEFGICSSGPLHCGGACQPGFSVAGSCYGDRPSAGRKCQSGFYDFKSTTWIINADAYNGDINTADFTIDPEGLNNGNVLLGKSGGIQLSLTPNPKPNISNPSQTWGPIPGTNGQLPPGLGGRISSTSYLMYGSFRTRMKTSGIPGVVTAFISYSDSKDEIDWEVTGEDNGKVQTNFFYEGVIDYTKSVSFQTGDDTSQVYHELEIDWREDRIVWYVDGVPKRTVLKSSTCGRNGQCAFPSTPSRIQLAIWDGGAGSKGTRDWAGGYVPWEQLGPRGGFHATYEYVSIRCNGDPEPVTVPARPKGYGPPSLKEPPISSTVPGSYGYNEDMMKRKQSVYSP